jgi:ElaA protein
VPVAWSFDRFEALGGFDVYEVLALRAEVFVVEQRCAYLDVDGKDPGAWHLRAREGSRLVAYARVLAPGQRFAEWSVGRVVVAEAHRGKGLARETMRRAMDAIADLAGDAVPIRLSAQAHLERFYGSLGFAREGDDYDEDGIPHVDMVRPRA